MDGVKICPKCQGNVFVAWDIGDGAWYEYCLQCAYRHYLPAILEKKPKKLTVKNRRKKRKRRKKNDAHKYE